MKSKIDCPYCEGTANIKHHLQEIIYKKEAFQINAHFYLCENCAEEFTTTETDELSMNQVYNLYREKHGIPFPEEIALVRENYGLSAAAMSEVLGLGVNGYGQYEKGEVPTTAIGNLIASAKNPWVFKDLLERANDLEPKSAYSKALEKVDRYINAKITPLPFYHQIDVHSRPNSYTGFKTPNLDIIKTLFSTFISSCNPLFNDRLKLNKLLFYVDFLAYKMSGYSISGLSYRPIQFGPVPSCYDNIFVLLENEMIIFADWQQGAGESPREIFFTNSKPQNEVLNNFENNIVDYVCNKFADSSSWDLVELSHKEKAWKDLLERKELINYQEYAFELRGIEMN